MKIKFAIAICLWVLYSVAFLYMYAYIIPNVVDGWVVESLSPIFKTIEINDRKTYSHIIGYSALFVTGSCFAFILLLPIGFFVRNRHHAAIVAFLCVVPTSVVSLLGSIPSSVSAWSLMLRPISGSLLFIAALYYWRASSVNSRQGTGLRNGSGVTH